MIKKVTAFIILLVIVVTLPLSCFASKLTTYKEEQDKLEEEQKDVKSQKSSAQEEVKKLSDEISDNEEKLEDIKNELNQLNKEIEETKKDLEEAQENYTKQEEALKQRIVAQCENGKTTYLDILLKSKGILQFISNYYIVSEILQYDTDLLNSISEQKAKIEKDKADLEEKQKKVKTQKAEQEKIKVVLTSQKTKKQNTISQLSKEEKELQAKIDEYDELIREEERKASQIANGSTGAYVGGDKVWPLPGHTRISSGFGGRNTGIPGASTNHKGIDIPASVGTSVVSVLDGKVIFTGYNRYRGYYIMVDHGGGVVTLYQHCQANSFKASVGSKVKAGQTIVLSGNTGIGSGPHLHFEVLINGKNVNPSTWLAQD